MSQTVVQCNDTEYYTCNRETLSPRNCQRMMRNESVGVLVMVSCNTWGLPTFFLGSSFLQGWHYLVPGPTVLPSHPGWAEPRYLCSIACLPILSGYRWDPYAVRQESILSLKWQPTRPPPHELLILFCRYLFAARPDKCISTLVGSKFPLIGTQNQPISICMHSLSFPKTNIIKGQKCDLHRLDTDFRYCTAASSFY